MKKILIIMVVSVLLIGGSYIYLNNKSNDEVLSFSDELYLIVEDIVVEGTPVIIEDNILYLSFEFIKNYIDENLFYDENEKTIIFTTETQVKRYRLNYTRGKVNTKEYIIENPIIEIGNSIFIPLDLIIDDYDIAINFYPDTNAVVMDYTDIFYLKGEVILDNPIIRTDLDIKSPLLENNLQIGSLVNVYGEYEKWFKIRTNDGIIGFIEKEYLKLNHTKDVYKTELIDRDIIKRRIDKINLTWDYTYGKVKSTDNIKPIEGLNVISPTWFSVTDDYGNIIDKGNKDYVIKYKEMGYEIWPLVDNSFKPELTHEILSSSTKREYVIESLLKLYVDYGFEGINVDFENIYLKDKDLLTQFVRELYPVFKEENIIVSMDITPISTSENWSLCYDRNRLHKTVDYIMLMAYDQHWAASPIAGSVAEYGWVENSIKSSLEIIPNDKLILAIPFYTRLWTIEGDKISSKSLSMDNASNFIQKNNIDMIWDEEVAQYYGNQMNGEKEYRIWLEDQKSLGYKISLVHKYNLAGISSWRKGFESANIWERINGYLN